MDRQQALQQIIEFGKQRELAVMALAQFGWDPSFPMIRVDNNVLISVLSKFMANEINADDLALWANFIECRDELDYSAIEGYIYALAEPEQMGGISQDTITQMLEILTSGL